MAKASKRFTAEQRQAVRDAIAEAERETSGEIVPVVATRSGRYDRAEDIVGVILALLAVAVVWLLFQRIEARSGDWESGHALALGLGWVLLAFLLGFVFGSALASFVPALAIPFVGKKERREEVLRGAQRAFFERRVRRTKAGTGILIYVSLLERMVCVLGDDPIAEKLDPAQWEEVRDLVIEGLRKGNPTDGICAGIRRCGELLAEHFPAAPGDVDELRNELHLID